MLCLLCVVSCVLCNCVLWHVLFVLYAAYCLLSVQFVCMFFVPGRGRQITRCTFCVMYYALSVVCRVLCASGCVVGVVCHVMCVTCRVFHVVRLALFVAGCIMCLVL